MSEPLITLTTPRGTVVAIPGSSVIGRPIGFTPDPATPPRAGLPADRQETSE